MFEHAVSEQALKVEDPGREFNTHCFQCVCSRGTPLSVKRISPDTAIHEQNGYATT